MTGGRVSGGGGAGGGRSGGIGRDRLPHREGHVLDPVVHLGAPRRSEVVNGGLGGCDSDHPLDVGHGDEKGTVGIPGAQERIDLEDGSARITRIHARAVVDDSLEDRQRSDPHATMLA